MVRGAKEIAAAVRQVLPADIAVFLIYTLGAVAVFLMARGMMDSLVMEVAEGPPFIGENLFLIFHNVLFVGSVFHQLRIMGMVMGRRHFFFMIVVMMVVMVVMMIMKVGGISVLFTARIVFMGLGCPFMMVAVAVAAAAIMGMDRFFFSVIGFPPYMEIVSINLYALILASP